MIRNSRFNNAYGKKDFLSFGCVTTLACHSAALAADADAIRVTFEGAKSEHKWALKDLNPDLPADWSAYNYLVMEFRVSSPQRFFFVAL